MLKKRVNAHLSRKRDPLFSGRPFARLQIRHCDPGGDGREELTQYAIEAVPLLARLDELEKGGRTDPGDIERVRAEILTHFGKL